MRVSSTNLDAQSSRWPVSGGVTAMVAAVIVASLAVAAFANSFAGTWVYDDVVEIARNPALDVLWPVWKPMTAGNRLPARFLPYLSFAVDRHIWGVSPAGFHLTNLLIHVVAAVSLFDLARITLASPRLRGRFESAAVPLAVAIATIWAVHPLQTQAVTYIYQRIESLAGMFSLLSLACFARAAAGGWPRAWLMACVASCAAAMASKETAVVLPLLILAYDWFFVAAKPAEIRDRKTVYVALAATWAILAVQLLVQRGRYQEFSDDGSTAAPIAYLLTQPEVILHYLRLAFWPAGQCLEYDWPIAASWRQIFLPGAAILLMLATTAYGAWRRKPWAWCGVVFFLALAPTSSILPVAAPAAEHRMYLPLAAVAAATVIGGFSCLRLLFDRGDREQSRPVWPWLFSTAALVAIGCLTIATHRRNELYADDVAIWEDVLARKPEHWRAHLTLATRASEQGDLAAAVSHAERSVRSRPRSPAFAYLAEQRRMAGDEAGAEKLVREGIDLQKQLLPINDPTRLTAEVVLAGMLHDAGRDAEAAAICEPLLEPLDRLVGDGHPTTITARTLLAFSARERGDLTAAERIARENLQSARVKLGAGDPTTQAAAEPLAKTLVDRGEPGQAEAMLRELLSQGQIASWLGLADLTTIQRLLGELVEQSPSAERLAEAESLRRAVYESLTCKLGRGHPQVGRAEVALGNARALRADADGRHADSANIAGATLEAAIERLGLPDPQTQRAAVAVAAALYRTGNEEKAEKILRDYLTDATKQRDAGGGKDAPPTIVRNALAGLWEQAGRMDEAIALRKKILRDALERHGPDHPLTQQSAEAVKAVLAARERGSEDASRPGGGVERSPAGDP